MDRNDLIEALQREGNLKYSFSAEEIASLAEYMSIEAVPEENILMKKGEPSESMVFIIDGLGKCLMVIDKLRLKKQEPLLEKASFQMKQLA
tara:strand:+ start:96 stop:368 length:273 start_codon:yes stop_codon:yes gene_type:complete